jgi:hypothetical protein
MASKRPIEEEGEFSQLTVDEFEPDSKRPKLESSKFIDDILELKDKKGSIDTNGSQGSWASFTEIYDADPKETRNILTLIIDYMKEKRQDFTNFEIVKPITDSLIGAIEYLKTFNSFENKIKQIKKRIIDEQKENTKEKEGLKEEKIVGIKQEITNSINTSLEEMNNFETILTPLKEKVNKYLLNQIEKLERDNSYDELLQLSQELVAFCDSLKIAIATKDYTLLRDFFDEDSDGTSGGSKGKKRKQKLSKRKQKKYGGKKSKKQRKSRRTKRKH